MGAANSEQRSMESSHSQAVGGMGPGGEPATGGRGDGVSLPLESSWVGEGLRGLLRRRALRCCGEAARAWLVVLKAFVRPSSSAASGSPPKSWRRTSWPAAGM